MRYDDNRYIDSTRVENQKFVFEGRTAIPSFCRIDAGRNYGNFILDEGTIKVNLYTHVPTGTKLNEAFNKTIATVDSIRKQGFAHLAELKKKSRMQKTGNRYGQNIMSRKSAHHSLDI